MLSTLAREGLGGDIVSIGEYRAARAAGMAPETILFSGVGKTADEMAEALGRRRCCQFNLESVEEARTLSAVAEAMGREAPVALRINPDVEAGTHAKITTGKADNKFGIARRGCGGGVQGDPRPARPQGDRRHRPYRQPADQPGPAGSRLHAAWEP